MIEQQGTFNSLVSMTDARIWHSLAQYSRETVIVVGGWLTDRDATNGCEWIDLTHRTCSEAPAMQHTRKFFKALGVQVRSGEFFETKVMAIRGQDETHESLTSVEILGQACPEIATIEVRGPLTFCQGNTVTLAAQEGYYCKWSNGATSRSIVVGTSGTYRVTISNNDGCTVSSQPITVVVVPAPAIPVITRSGSTLVSTSALTYQWSLNGIPIVGAIDRVYTPTEVGEYTVTITVGGECSLHPRRTLSGKKSGTGWVMPAWRRRPGSKR